MKRLNGFGHQLMLSLFLATAALPASSDPVGDEVRKLQLGWERATYQAPLQVDTVVTSVWKGNRLLTPVAGGVMIQARNALAKENIVADERGQTAHARSETSLKDLAPGQWWWD